MTRLDALDLDFAGQRRAAPADGLLLLLVGAIAAFFTFTDFEAARAALTQQHSEKKKIEDLIADIRRMESNSAKLSPSEQRLARAASNVARDLQAPWIDFLSAIESLPLKDATLLSIEPRISAQTVRIIGEAKTPQAMLALADQLRTEVKLAEVTIVSHQIMSATPGQPWRFQIQAGWSRP